jgi:hypothetical protein
MWSRVVLAYQLVVQIEWTLLGSAWLGMRGEKRQALANHTAQKGALGGKLDC